MRLRAQVARAARELDALHLDRGPRGGEQHDVAAGALRQRERTSVEGGAQAGLSWQTVLAKRENYRKAFDGFNVEKIARYKEPKIEKLLADAGIIRNQLKIRAAVTNAQALLRLRETAAHPELALTDFFWQFVDGRPKQNALKRKEDIKATTPESDALSKALLKAGFKFVGSTIVYAHMQACGMVNDHLTSCWRYEAVREMGRQL